MLISLTLTDGSTVAVNSAKIILASEERNDEPVSCVEIEGAKGEIYVKETPQEIINREADRDPQSLPSQD